MRIIDVHTHAYTARYGRTDYPHQVHDMAGMLDKTAGMPPDRRAAIRAGNARRLFEI